MELRSLETIDPGRLLRLEADLSDTRIDAVIEYLRGRYSLANIAYVCPGFRGRSIKDPFLALTYSDAWVEHYLGEGYHCIDPVMSFGARSVLPVDWAVLPRLETKVRRLFDDAREAGVGVQGLTIPVRGPVNGLWALFNVTSYDSDGEWAARRHELMRDMVHVAHFVHQKAYDLHGAGEEIDLGALTRREIEALQWAAEGATVEEIGVAMRIANETVKAHLDSARYKLRALNRTHAIAKALRAGLIR
jgi:DNA-binding CsgD family transcriptional regulator